MHRHSRPLFTLALLAAACGTEGPGTAPIITELPRALTIAETKLVAANNRFAFNLLRQVTADTRDSMPNLFVSPLSVSIALGMTYNGAAGTTAAAMHQVLQFGDLTIGDVNAGYRDLIGLLRGLDPRVRFQLANSIWHRHTLPVESAFVAVNRDYFDAQVEALDFTAPDAGRRINDWVARGTQNRITDIVPQQLPEGALLYLINAIYFKGDWTSRFDADLTRPAPFRLGDGSTVMATRMSTGEPVPVRTGSSPGVLVVDLPYGGRAFSLTIVMPHDPAAFDGLLDSVTAAQWDAWVASLDSAEMPVSLPKFTLENDLSLNATLQALGMSVAFSCDPPEPADFSGMVGPPPPPGPCITNVKHKTFVAVDEEGTEAAAATAVEIGPTSLPPEIVIDGPFLFALRENLSGTILFMGAIRNPAVLH